jgi:hypothetical protein
MIYRLMVAPLLATVVAAWPAAGQIVTPGQTTPKIPGLTFTPAPSPPTGAPPIGSGQFLGPPAISPANTPPPSPSPPSGGTITGTGNNDLVPSGGANFSANGTVPPDPKGPYPCPPGCDCTALQAAAQASVLHEIQLAKDVLVHPPSVAQLSCLNVILGIKINLFGGFDPSAILQGIIDQVMAGICKEALSVWNQATAPLRQVANIPGLKLPGNITIPGQSFGTNVALGNGQNGPGISVDGTTVFDPYNINGVPPGSGGAGGILGFNPKQPFITNPNDPVLKPQMPEPKIDNSNFMNSLLKKLF